MFSGSLHSRQWALWFKLVILSKNNAFNICRRQVGFSSLYRLYKCFFLR